LRLCIIRKYILKALRITVRSAFLWMRFFRALSTSNGV
jgi:hypothetical protein